MYRIEVATGEATVFRTVEELATGIRNGLITPSSRIWHGASQKWLPIDIHPHYKKALDLVTGGAPMIDTGLRPSPRRTPAPAPRPPEHRAATPSPAPVPTPRPAEHRAVVPSPASSPAPSTAPRPSEFRAVAPPSPAPRPPEPRAVAPAPAPIVPAAPTPAPVPPGPGPSASADFPPSAGLPRLSPWPFGAPPVTERHRPAQQESAVLTAPAPAQWDAVDAPVAVAGDEVALPTITYPEVPEPLPAELFQPVARRRPGGRTSFMLGGIVAVAIVGGVFALRSKQSAGFAAEPPRAQEQVSAPAETESEFGGEAAFPDEPVAESAPVKSAVSAPAPTLQPVSARAHGAAPAETRPPATSPVFTPVPRPTGPVSQAWSASAGAIAPTAPPPSPSSAATPADAPAISPPPAAIDLSLPRLPSAETVGVAAEAKRDSATMKRILRAVSGRPAGGKSAQ